MIAPRENGKTLQPPKVLVTLHSALRVVLAVTPREPAMGWAQSAVKAVQFKASVTILGSTQADPPYQKTGLLTMQPPALRHNQSAGKLQTVAKHAQRAVTQEKRGVSPIKKPHYYPRPE